MSLNLAEATVQALLKGTWLRVNDLVHLTLLILIWLIGRYVIYRMYQSIGVLLIFMRGHVYIACMSVFKG